MAPEFIKLLCRRRRRQFGYTRIVLAVVFTLWIMSMVYYGMCQPAEEEKHGAHVNQHQRQPQSQQNQIHHQQQQFYEDTARRVTSSFKADHRNNIGVVQEQGQFKHVRVNDAFDKDHYPHKKFTYKHGEQRFTEDATRHIRTLPHYVIKHKKEYTEFDWEARLAWESVSHRVTIVPGKRVDAPRSGEFGRAVNIKPANLNRVDRIQYQTGWDIHKFNEFASKKISLQREVPDFRNNQCKQEFDYNKNSLILPKVSIIICFYNEAWSVLIRSIHSVLRRSSPDLIEEIILVDDSSDHDVLKEPLEKFVAKTNKLRLLRMTNRTGLVRARLAGVDAAKAPVLIFLDSHIECGKGWLPPLLETLVDNPTFAVTPQIDVISDKTFAISAATENIGILKFSTFSFTWGPVLPRIKKTIKSPTDPFQSPTMAGGLFAIRKEFFISIGTYDEQLALWGGENIELSLKLWLCGGGILTHPCSRVGHVFRDKSPYLTGNLIHVPKRNSARVALVWGDEYKKFFFKGNNLKDEDWKIIKKDVHKQLYLRKRLECKPFRWFLDHVFPEIFIPRSGIFFGPMRSSNGLCIIEDLQEEQGTLILAECDNPRPWEMSRGNEIRNLKRCMTVGPMEEEVVSTICDFQGQFQVFEYNIEDHTIYHPRTDRCLTVSPNGLRVYVLPCQQSSADQEWHWPVNPDHIP